MNSNNKEIRNVAAAALKIMMGEDKGAKPDFLDLDKDGDKEESMKKASKDAKMKKEPEMKKEDMMMPDKKKEKMAVGITKDKRYGGNMTKQVGIMNKIQPGLDKKPAVSKAIDKANEDVEQIQEYGSMGGVYKHKGTYGTSYKTDQEGKEMKPVKKMPGARQNFVRSTRVNEKKPKMESFSDLVNLINEEGYKALPKIATYTMKFGDNEVEVLDANHVNDAGMTTIAEEPDSETFEKERKDQMEKMTGKKKGSNLAAAPREPVVQTEELDKHDKPKVKKIISKLKGASDAHAGQAKDLEKAVNEELQERELTKDEKKDKEDYVMGMKKNMKGFKERYGKDARSVMYGAATNMARKTQDKE